MKITKIEGFQLRCPCAEIHDALSTSTARQAFLIKVETDNGLYGIGEAFSFGAPMGALQEILKNQIEPILIGQKAENIEQLWRTMYWRTIANGRRSLTMAVISGIDIALWDLLGKETNLPIAQLLGACYDKIPTYASGGFYAPKKDLDGLRREISGYMEKGYRDVKIKIGRTFNQNQILHYMANQKDTVSLEEDWQRIQATKEIIGNGTLIVDTNASWSEEQFITNGPTLLDLGVHIIEEPLPFEDITGYRKVAAAVPQLVVAGCETQQGVLNFYNLIHENQIDIVQPDVGWAGGISEVKKIGDMALASGKKISLHCFGSAVLFAASLQVAAAMSNTIAMESEENPNPLKSSLTKSPFLTNSAMDFYVPEGPGLGIEINEDQLMQFIC
ncbi:mandelate racemase/muconate lactonizing enzyme family protein [Acidaminococcus timonensis]|uniref:mandelate racemase/muconate lactonizing enzyme family protein n=1 Tax=Acidaminococcus timonensis TaxID=1871002 RepID=UPI0030806033